MAVPIISALVKDLVGRLTSAAVQVYSLLWGLEDDLSALENNFKLIQGILHDAEKKQTKNKIWLKTLKFASLEAENVLDEANTEAMIQRMHQEMGWKYKLRTFYTRYNPLMVRFRIAHKVNKIRKKLDEIKSNFDLTASNTTSKDDAGIGGVILNRETTSSIPTLKSIIGRDKDKKIIVDKICNHDYNVRVYAIWGMGGIGKTTLAQYVYNHEKVRTNFELKCWVYVSAVFDKKRIIKQIIKSICGLEDKKLDEVSLNHLLRQLLNKLEGKKYFIIMDDVRMENKDEDMKKWDELCKALRCGAKGSTVIVTTRNEITARLMTKNIPELQHNMGVLSKEESWSLFKMFAFQDTGDAEKVSPELKLVGDEIVKKCNGLPLAVKTLGCLMLTKENKVDEWRAVNDNSKWEKDDDIVLSALRLSYDDLPPHTKICFAYCCLFLKGEEMSKDSLIELWMANGFIPSEGDPSLYVLGEEIFDSLVGRSFFQDVVEKDIHTGVICKMHDLMHDLAQYEMKHDCAVIESGKESIIPEEVLHLSLSCEDFEFSEQDLEKLRSVRSMLDWRYTSNITQISNHVYLRVLYLNGIESPTLPESISKLIHLRYLKISDSQIIVLPESIIYLQNLQVLILKECQSLCKLPKGLRYMRNLQHLDTGGYCPYLRCMPVGIKELTNLRRLSHFVVGNDDGARISELGNLNLLGMRKLTLSGLENVGGLRDAKSANLKDKTNLKSLTLEWHGLGTFYSEVLEGLEPNSGLQELKIEGYMGGVLSPSWMVKLVNLTSIKFSELPKCEQLPPLGKLPCLRSIRLQDIVLKCFHDDDKAISKDENLFPSLQKLDIMFSGLVSLPSNFPKLRSLYISHCPNLRSLPEEIQSFTDLKELTIKDCGFLKDWGEYWHKISHIPHLDIETPRMRTRTRIAKNYRDEDKNLSLV